MYTEQFFINGIGCASYLVGCESAGTAAVIDPDREVQKYLDAAEAHGLKITHILETHLHADHVSGNTELAARTGAEIYLYEGANAEFPHQKLQDGGHVMIGNVRMDVLHTPGHTPESITLLATDLTRGDEAWMAFTGDTLFVGDAGRPDLVGADEARRLAAQMHTSLTHKLLPLDDGLMIFPGHGAGSLCGKSIGAVRSTTLGYERKHNEALAPRTQAEYVAFATENLPEQPGNHTRIKAINRAGPARLGNVEPKPLSIREAIEYFQRGAALLDTRSRAEYAKAHIPGSTHLEADEHLSNRIGFVLPTDIPIVLLPEDPAEYKSLVYALARVGFENVVGYLAESLEDWHAMGLPITSGDVRDIEPVELDKLMQNGNGNAPVVMDVREPWEFQQGHVPNAVLMPLGDLARRVTELDPGTPVAVICASGSRSQSAAALLSQKGFKTVYNVRGGTERWRRMGLTLVR